MINTNVHTNVHRNPLIQIHIFSKHIRNFSRSILKLHSPLVLIIQGLKRKKEVLVNISLENSRLFILMMCKLEFLYLIS